MIGTKTFKIGGEMAKKNKLEVGNMATPLAPLKMNPQSDAVNFEEGCQLRVFSSNLKVLVPIMQHLC